MEHAEKLKELADELVNQLKYNSHDFDTIASVMTEMSALLGEIEDEVFPEGTMPS